MSERRDLVKPPSPELCVAPATQYGETYSRPVAGLPAVVKAMVYAHETAGLVRGTRALLRLNQVGGFDCPSCAWPDPAHRAVAEFCENGARAAVHEADTRRADAAFFAARSIASLESESDFWLEQQGRLVTPLVKRSGADHYEPIAYEEAFALVGTALRELASPHQALFYTSGRASNEAAFLYQLLARTLGTNNLPDCSNMCHESTSVGLGEVIGIGKGTVSLEDFDHADCIILIGQNPGTNHPRMLSTLALAHARGCRIIAINPIRERGLEAFAHPQTVKGVLGFGENIATHFAHVRVGGDVALMKGIMKALYTLERARQPGDAPIIDRAFIDEHTSGEAELASDLDATSWDDIAEESGVSHAAITELAAVYAGAERTIACWAMGVTQHKNGVDNVRAIMNLLLLRGNIGRPGAGACPVRGHSNVQGDRTVGIYEAPKEAFLARLDAAVGITSPREKGFDAVAAAQALEDGRARFFMGMGGNYARAMSDCDRVHAALKRAQFTVHVATKLNRTHLACGDVSVILPCLGRSERDVRGGRAQFVSVEDSMSVVHASQGHLPPADAMLESETSIVCGIARHALGDTRPVDWSALANDYDKVRDVIAASVAGFDNYNARVREKLGFVLPSGARERVFKTKTNKARFSVTPLVHRRLAPGQLLLMTIRSHDQFNTTLYGNDDRYRGIYGRRDVVLMQGDDMRERGFAQDDAVDITSHFEGQTRTLRGFHVHRFDLPRGNVAAYYPETNPLVPLESFADESRTPTSKAIVVTLARATS